jgi:uncharacterized protein YecE (DUF72 family)
MGTFPSEGSHLQRYAACYNAVEINSSFYRSHRPATYARWRDAVPEHFRFSVKLPREITHKRRLTDSLGLLDSFLDEARELGPKLGPLLVQLPPKLEFETPAAPDFLRAFRTRFGGSIVIEPRHPTWFAAAANQLIEELNIARAAADPPPVPGADLPAGCTALCYYRLHGSPDMYYSSYTEPYLAKLADTLCCSAVPEVWCIFDNTARQHATVNALRLVELLSSP